MRQAVEYGKYFIKSVVVPLIHSLNRVLMTDSNDDDKLDLLKLILTHMHQEVANYGYDHFMKQGNLKGFNSFLEYFGTEVRKEAFEAVLSSCHAFASHKYAQSRTGRARVLLDAEHAFLSVPHTDEKPKSGRKRESSQRSHESVAEPYALDSKW